MPQEQVADLASGDGTVTAGSHRPSPPQRQPFWVASVSGSGEQSLAWDVREGEWRAVVMAADGTPSVSAELEVGAELPGLLGFSLCLIGAAALLLSCAGVVLVAITAGAETWRRYA